MRSTRTLAAVAASISVLGLAACSADTAEPSASTSPTDGPADVAGTTVTVVTHDSFAVPDDVLAAFEEETGMTVDFVAPGDAGTLVNQLVLTKDAPLGDVVYGLDNTFASRAVDNGVLAAYSSSAPAASDAAEYAIPGAADLLTAIDVSDVCLNYDLAYFEGSDLDAPTSLSDLTDPAYAGLVSVTNPATSSPGLAFLLATIGSEGDDWQQWWTDMAANGLRVTASWSDSYYTDFSAPNYGGDYPIVLSYASSPPYEVIDGEPTTAALLDGCFRQVEYVGVLEGAENVAGAQLVVDWMLSDEFQATIPENMYVYPVSSSVEIPAEWAEYAPLAGSPITLDPAEVDANRDAWIDEWTSIVLD
ncbi:thiamine ABC transporter substrate-binding protein [Demequina zhanjiangensis]|uniref:Thiamine ABC transporter substrate-binding protein n=1 Tax=Demequina zhanjiangensis TaxID=3051659 RepID=A0ABT8G5P1_9MICO|nr:thiamine ABC transporter substrate-binding protein [Demequina sp. SYSU T00b26]MDN4474049.1 thiamine ABC transporter substrate-binding protein [Demequina sp. SYSU T00b26]